MLSGLHTRDSCKRVISVQFLQMWRSGALLMLCSILLYDQPTILTSGLDWCEKKRNRKERNDTSLCSLMRKLTSANPHEASPVTSTIVPNHYLHMCFTSVHTTDTLTVRSLPHDRLIVVPGGFLFWANHFLNFLSTCITFNWCCSIFKPFAAGG